MARYDLPDGAWTIIKPLLPPEPATRRAGRPWAEHRKIINGMFRGLCSGAPWRDLPERYGPWKTVYNRLNRGQSQAWLPSLSTGCSLYLMSTALLTGLPPRWMAVISGR